MPAEHRYMRIQLKKEQYRLLDWGHVAGVAERDDALVIRSADKGLLHDVLEQQQLLLHSFGKFDRHYKRLEKPFLRETTPNTVSENRNDEDFAADDDTKRSAGGHLLQRADTDFQNRFPQEGETLLQKTLEWAQKSRAYPRRLRWAAFDKAKVEQLLLKLASFNDFLRELLSAQQLDRLLARQERTDFHIIQLNNKIDQLVEIVQAGSAWSHLTGVSASSSPPDRGPADPLWLRAKVLLGDLSLSSSSSTTLFVGDEMPGDFSGQSLARLAQFKALERAISTSALTDERVEALRLGTSARELFNVELVPDEIKLLADDDEDGDDREENQRSEATFHNKRVWIEWKAYEPQVLDGEPDPRVLQRIVALVALLKENNRSEQFRAPRCLGYFRDMDPDTLEDRCRFGVVFEKPRDVGPRTKPVSLLDLLRAADAGKVEVPSLTERVQLARAVAAALEKLHAVNWLHKGLRSGNILFFSDELDPEDLRVDGGDSSDHVYPMPLHLDFSEPYLSGFDYSRPAQNEDLTEKPPENAAHDLYRHPLVQGSRGTVDNSSNFKKSYDIYALGVILLEIVFWQPIDRVLDINLQKVRPSMPMKVRTRLLGERRFLAQVRANAGGMVESVVRACLVGPAALVDGTVEERSENEEWDDRNAIVAARLQIGFYEKVVEKLGEVKV